MGAALKLKQPALSGRQTGELARLKVVHGPDYGSTFVLTSTRATVGRGEDNDVMIADLKASRKHAEFVLTQQGWGVRDLGSANGILHNGKATRQAMLKAGDSVAVGETLFEFAPADLATRALAAPPRTPVQHRSQQQALEQQLHKARAPAAHGHAPRPGAPGGGKGKSKGANPVLLLGALALVGFFLLTPDKPKTAGSAGGSRPAAVGIPGLDTGAPVPGSEGILRTADMFFRAGFREYRERNYLRARQQFESALQIAPGHPLATLYLQNANHQIDEEVKFHLDAGKKCLVAGKLKEARGHFESVQRLLFRDQANPAYTEAGEQLDRVLRQLKGLPELLPALRAPAAAAGPGEGGGA
jgi:hypothetical protein